MKIVIELNDADLHKAVNEQVDKAVAALATDRISVKINEILEKKFGRINEAAIEKAVGIAAADLIRKVDGLSSEYHLRSRVDGALASAARALLREQQVRL